MTSSRCDLPTFFLMTLVSQHSRFFPGHYGKNESVDLHEIDEYTHAVFILFTSLILHLAVGLAYLADFATGLKHFIDDG